MSQRHKDLDHQLMVARQRLKESIGGVDEARAREAVRYVERLLAQHNAAMYNESASQAPFIQAAQARANQASIEWVAEAEKIREAKAKASRLASQQKRALKRVAERAVRPMNALAAAAAAGQDAEFLAFAAAFEAAADSFAAEDRARAAAEDAANETDPDEEASVFKKHRVGASLAKSMASMTVRETCLKCRAKYPPVLCGACLDARYCSEACKHADLAQHKKVCDKSPYSLAH